MSLLQFRIWALFFLATAQNSFAQSVTFDFTGTVTSTFGQEESIPDGATVTGTYTFDYAAANASQSSGSVGSPSLWTAESMNGTLYGIPAQNAFVFSSTAQVDGFSYGTGPASGYSNVSIVGGFVSTAPGFPGSFNASENTQASSTAPVAQSYFNVAAYTSGGYPIFSPGTAASGAFAQGVIGGRGGIEYTGVVAYNLTSLTMASALPEAHPALMLILGLSTFAAMMRRGRQ